MPIFGMLILWAAYALGLWGYCLLRGYCVTIADVVNWNYPASVGGTASSSKGS